MPRSLTGKGVVETLEYIQEIIPLEIKQVKSGTKVFDWTVPPEWNINDAYVIDVKTNKKVIDFKKHNLHVVGYSEPIDDEMSFLTALLSDNDVAPLQLSAGPWSHESCTWDLQSTEHSTLLY